MRYTAPDLPLRRTPPPDGLPSSGRYRPVALDLAAATTLPPVTSPGLTGVGLDADGWRRYERLLRWREDRERPLHRLLGHQSVVQTHDQPLACEQASSGDTSRSPEVREREARA